MIIAITGTPGTGKTEVAKALAKRLGWWCVSLNELAEEEDLYRGYDEERMCKIVDLERMREEVNILAVSHKNLIIESHYAHEMPSDIVFVLRTDPEVLRKRMVKKGFWTEKIAENLEAEMMNVIRDEALALKKNVYEIDTTRTTPEKVAGKIESIIKNQPFITRDLKVPEDLLIEFRKPFGKVLGKDRDEAAERVKERVRGRKKLVVSVGDSASYYLIKHGLEPNMIIIDGKERRKMFGKKIEFHGEEVKAENPPGHITVDLWKAVENSVPRLKEERIKIRVKGEEDLAVLPCAIHLPLGSYIVYGHFDLGLILVKLNKDRKDRAKALLENVMFSQ